MRTPAIALALALIAAACTACGDDGGGPINPEELITAVQLDFAPTGGGAAVTAVFDDPDGDGGAPPTIDPINLIGGRTYMLAVRFQNRLVTPPEEITDEVRDEQDFHLVLFTGSAVASAGPLTHAYLDTDSKGLPVGLTSSITTRTGVGQLTITLRHMPPEQPPVKAADTVELAKTAGIDAIGGATDAQVTFMVTVSDLVTPESVSSAPRATR